MIDRIDLRVGDISESFSSSVSYSSVISTDFSLPSCSDFVHLGYECVQYFLCKDGEIRNVSDVNYLVEYVIEEQQNARERFQLEGPGQREKGKFTPWNKKCLNKDDVCCKNPKFSENGDKKAKKGKQKKKAKSLPSNSLCPNDYSGPQPYPQDCSKFANCWKGRATVQDCAPGTLFNSKTNQCDFPSKAKCSGNNRSGKAKQIKKRIYSYAKDEEGLERSSGT